MKTKNYHGEQVEFTTNQTVTHVTDDGEMVQGKVTNIDGDSLHLEFVDGEEGWEKAVTCF